MIFKLSYCIIASMSCKKSPLFTHVTIFGFQPTVPSSNHRGIRFDFFVGRSSEPGKAIVRTLEICELGFSMLGKKDQPLRVFCFFVGKKGKLRVGGKKWQKQGQNVVVI